MSPPLAVLDLGLLLHRILVNRFVGRGDPRVDDLDPQIVQADAGRDLPRGCVEPARRERAAARGVRRGARAGALLAVYRSQNQSLTKPVVSWTKSVM